MVVWPYLVLLASVSAVGNPAILSVQAPWGFIPVGLDYFTHPHIDKDDATHTIVFLTLWKAASGRQVGRGWVGGCVNIGWLGLAEPKPGGSDARSVLVVAGMVKAN